MDQPCARIIESGPNKGKVCGRTHCPYHTVKASTGSPALPPSRTSLPSKKPKLECPARLGSGGICGRDISTKSCQYHGLLLCNVLLASGTRQGECCGTNIEKQECSYHGKQFMLRQSEQDAAPKSTAPLDAHLVERMSWESMLKQYGAKVPLLKQVEAIRAANVKEFGKKDEVPEYEKFKAASVSQQFAHEGTVYCAVLFDGPTGHVYVGSAAHGAETRWFLDGNSHATCARRVQQDKWGSKRNPFLVDCMLARVGTKQLKLSVLQTGGFGMARMEPHERNYINKAGLTHAPGLNGH
eukprot:NODE_2339_length_1085_cov_81.141962_g2321_i0.p1 GENE.NODE_2339_length_1085_cov_81.141962_g2321_i0~~NODE_2339_length_1085_cov_81.141962_g2321_i0.p1  ORF type:complete len:297 (+),score=21.50 NODE_2339_length_1085_cov_81.141962_g2321_i0:88-978(+)